MKNYTNYRNSLILFKCFFLLLTYSFILCFLDILASLTSINTDNQSDSSGPSSFSCQECLGKTFVSIGNLRKHVKQKHPGE